MPSRDAARQVLCSEAAASQLGNRIAADLKAVDAIGDDRLVARQFLSPVSDRFWCPDLRLRQHVRALGKIVGEADVENDDVFAALHSCA